MEEGVDSWMDEDDEEVRRLHLLVLNQQIMIAHIICRIVYYLAYRKSQQVNLPNDDVDVEILSNVPSSQVPSQSGATSSKGKRKNIETLEEGMKSSLDKIANAIERSTDAILQSSASLARLRPRVISSEEITEALEEMGVDGQFFDDAFEFLTDNLEKAKKLFGYPKMGRLAYMEKLIYPTHGTS